MREEKSDGDLAVSMDERLEEINDTREVVKALEITVSVSLSHAVLV